MKTKLTITAILFAFTAYSQNQKGSLSWPPQDTIKYQYPFNTMSLIYKIPERVLIGVLINPVNRTGIKYTDRELWLIYNQPMNQKQYDIFVAGFVFENEPDFKVVHIEIQRHEYTFEEFRKILWP